MKSFISIAIIICLFVALCGSCCFVDENIDIVEETTTEVSYTTIATATIVKIDMVEYGIQSKRREFYASVLSDDYINVIEITKEQYVQLNIGDTVTIRKNRDNWIQIEEFNTRNTFFMDNIR